MNTRSYQTLIGFAALGVAGLMAWGAKDIPHEAGYAGIGPDFVPWLVAAVLAICASLLLVQALRGGYANFPEPSGAPQADWISFAWVSAGILLNAALIERVGFVLSCTLCYVLAVRGLRRAEGKGRGGMQEILVDVLIGFVLSAPVYWLFGKLLKINLPGLTSTGWL